MIEGIVLLVGNKISWKGIEVDLTKIDAMGKLPPLSNIKILQSFLGHASFYW